MVRPSQKFALLQHRVSTKTVQKNQLDQCCVTAKSITIPNRIHNGLQQQITLCSFCLLSVTATCYHQHVIQKYTLHILQRKRAIVQQVRSPLDKP